MDPLWAIADEPEHRGGGWQLSEFFDTGEAEVSEVLRVADDLGEPVRPCACTRLWVWCLVVLRSPLADRFRECVGLDISEGMVKLARELNDDRPNCRFVVNAAPDLAQFDTQDRSTSFYSSLVASAHALGGNGRALRQRVPAGPPPRRARSLPGLCRTSRWLSACSLAGACMRFLRSVGLPEQFLVMKMKLTPARGLAVPEATMRRFIEQHGGTVEFVEAYGERAKQEHVSSLRYFARAS